MRAQLSCAAYEFVLLFVSCSGEVALCFLLTRRDGCPEHVIPDRSCDAEVERLRMMMMQGMMATGLAEPVLTAQ